MVLLENNADLCSHYAPIRAPILPALTDNVLTLTDNNSTTWTDTSGRKNYCNNSATNKSQQVFYLKNVPSNLISLNVTFSGAVSNPHAYMQEYSGIDATNSVQNISVQCWNVGAFGSGTLFGIPKVASTDFVGWFPDTSLPVTSFFSPTLRDNSVTNAYSYALTDNAGNASAQVSLTNGCSSLNCANGSGIAVILKST